MAGFKFDHEKEGLSKTLKEYEEIALRHVWSIGEEGVGSGKLWAITNEKLGLDKTVSRASVILFMNRMVDGVGGERDKLLPADSTGTDFRLSLHLRIYRMRVNFVPHPNK